MKKIGEIAKVSVGQNSSRINLLEDEVFYDRDMFERDLNSMHLLANCTCKISYKKDVLRCKDIVISTTDQMATLVGCSVRKRILDQNFYFVDLDDSVEKEYFIYLYNMNSIVKRQKDRESMSMGISKRLTINAIVNINMPIIEKDRQIKIGKTYVTMIKLKREFAKISESYEALTRNILENTVEESTND